MDCCCISLGIFYSFSSQSREKLSGRIWNRHTFTVRSILSLGLKCASLKQMQFLHTHTHTHTCAYITEVIRTVQTFTGNSYPIWNKGWEKCVHAAHHQQWTCRTGNTTAQYPNGLLQFYWQTRKGQSMTMLADHMRWECDCECYCTPPQHQVPYCTPPQHQVPYCTPPQHQVPYCTPPQHQVPYCTPPQHQVPYSSAEW
jgi:hypothetical protein